MTRRSGSLLASALAGLLLVGAVALPGGQGLPPAWVATCVFWGGLSLGSLVLLMIHQLSGGAWGEALRRPLLAAAGVLPLLLVLLLPLLVTPERWYPWADTGLLTLDSVPVWYLNVPFFRLRALLYLVVWLTLAWAVGAWGRRDGTVARRARRISPGGLVILLGTTSLASFDWVMSLDPQWYSAIFGLLVTAGQVTAALALAVLWYAAARAATAPDPQLLNDFGNLLLTLLLLWTYLVGMQFITIWIADLPREIRWYLPRLQTDWRWMGLVILTLHLFVPLPLLLSRSIKRSRAGLGLAAALLLGAQGLYALWLTLPTLRPQGLQLALADLAVFAGVGGLWLSAFLWHSARIGVPQADRVQAGGVA
jgi:hypothetical protein